MNDNILCCICHTNTFELKIGNEYPHTLISCFLKQKVDKINSLLTCLRHMYFRGMTAGFLSSHWIFFALHSVILRACGLIRSNMVASKKNHEQKPCIPHRVGGNRKRQYYRGK